jgi:hypothetical protein
MSAKEVSEYLARIGRKGGRARVPKGFAMLTAEQRKESASKAAKARWARVKKKAAGKRKEC